MVTTGQLIHEVATLYAAIDRLRSFLPDPGKPVSPTGRTLLETAAHDVARAWTQVWKRTREIEDETTQAAAAALGRAARALGVAMLCISDPGAPLGGEFAVPQDEVDAVDTARIRCLAVPGGAGEDR